MGTRKKDDTNVSTMKLLHTGAATRQAILFAVLAGSVVMLGACDSLILDREPEVAHLEISSSDASEGFLVTSRFFVEIADPDCPTAGQAASRSPLHPSTAGPHLRQNTSPRPCSTRSERVVTAWARILVRSLRIR